MAAEQPLNDTQSFVVGNMNEKCAKCTKCSCLLLRENHGVYVSFEVELPLETAKSDGNGETEMESLSEWLEVADIFTFENMGFSNLVNNKKYLVCADCEVGPIGYQDIQSGKSYLSCKRVKME